MRDGKQLKCFKKAVFIGLLLAFGVSFSLLGKTNLRVVTEHLPPFQVSNENGEASGIVLDQIKFILNNISPQTEIEVMPWTNAYQIALNRPNTVIFSLIRTPERESKFIWISKLINVKTILIALNSSTAEYTTQLSNLKNLKVGVKANDAVGQELIKNGFSFDKNLIEIIDTSSSIKMLQKKRFDLVPANRFMLDYYCSINDCHTTSFKEVYVFDELDQDFYLAVSLGTEPSVIKQLREELSTLKLPIEAKAGH